MLKNTYNQHIELIDTSHYAQLFFRDELGRAPVALFDKVRSNIVLRTEVVNLMWLKTELNKINKKGKRTI